MTRFHVAFVLAPHSVAVAVVDRAAPGRLPLARREMPAATGPRDVLEAGWELVCRELSRRGAEPVHVTGVALCLAGAIDNDDRPSGPEWPDTWRGIELREWAAAQFPRTERGAGVVVTDEVSLLAKGWTPAELATVLLIASDESIAARWRGLRLPLGPLTPGLLAWSVPPKGGRVCDVASGPALVTRWNEVAAARHVSTQRFGTAKTNAAPTELVALADLLAHAVRDEPTARALLADAAVALAWASAQLLLIYPGVVTIRLAGPLADLPTDLFLDPYRRQLQEWLALSRGETTRTTGFMPTVSALPRSRELLLERAIDSLDNRPQGGLRLHHDGYDEDDAAEVHAQGDR
jgi:hypothetical protein